MDKKDLFTAGIFFISFLSLLLVSFSALLSPIKKDIGGLDTDIKETRTELKAEFHSRMNHIDSRMNHIENRMNSIEKKIDLLLTKGKQAKTP